MKNINILLLDTEYSLKSMLELLSMTHINLIIFNSNHGKLIEVYKSNKIDIVIADILIESNKNILDQLIKINPMQKILITTKEFPCYIKDNCEYCVNNHNLKFLLKPVSEDTLYDNIFYFDKLKCFYANYHIDTKSFLPNILRRYKYYEYDFNKEYIQTKEKSSNNLASSNELINICDLLKNLNIKYKMINKNTIEIH